jgi:hypothetical protein
MNILKIGLVAAVLWQSSPGYAEVEADGNELPPPAVKQLCEEIIASGNVAYEYLDGGTPGAMTNTFGIGSNGWYAFKDVNRILEDIVVHPSILPFLRYRYEDGRITGVELSCDEDATETLCQKAVALSLSAIHINIPMKKLPYPTPKTWKNNLKSLSAPGLKHVRRGTVKGTYSNHCKIQSVDLPSAESIGYAAFNYVNINSLKLSNALKFTNYAFNYNKILSVNIPHFTHFLSSSTFSTSGDGIGFKLLSTTDLLRPREYALYSSPVTLSVTCYSRINNILKLLNKMDYSLNSSVLKNLNIKIGDSIKHVVNTGYINGILAMNKGSYDVLDHITRNNGCGFLDFSNTEMSETNLRTINKTGNLPWILSFPHITTVDSSFNTLFKQLKGVILNDVGLVTDGAFDDCSFTTLGFGDTTLFDGTPLNGLTPSILELTVTQPQNVSCFLSTLEGAGLGLSSIGNLSLNPQTKWLRARI